MRMNLRVAIGAASALRALQLIDLRIYGSPGFQFHRMKSGELRRRKERATGSAEPWRGLLACCLDQRIIPLPTDTHTPQGYLLTFMLCSDRTFTRLNGVLSWPNNENQRKQQSLSGPRELAGKADSVAEAEMMSRSAWLRRLVAAKVGEVLA